MVVIYCDASTVQEAFGRTTNGSAGNEWKMMHINMNALSQRKGSESSGETECEASLTGGWYNTTAEIGKTGESFEIWMMPKDWMEDLLLMHKK